MTESVRQRKPAGSAAAAAANAAPSPLTKQSILKHWPLVALVGGLAALLFISAPALLPFLPPAAASKHHERFSAFYKETYLPEHSQRGTQMLHVVGTVIMLSQLARAPALGLALVLALALGLSVFPLMRWLSTGIVEMALMLGVYLYVGTVLTGSARRAFVVPLIGYGFAWAGHFFVEHNKPTTFLYPVFSLVGDFQMCIELIAGAVVNAVVPKTA